MTSNEPPASVDLMRCPFCGGEASLTIPSDLNTAQYDDVYVCCDECEIRGQAVLVELAENVEGRFPDEEAEAIAVWNTRASTPPARPGRESIPYSHAIGEAGQAYIKKVSPNGDAVLGGNFYYANLWEAMQEAALGALFDGAGA